MDLSSCNSLKHCVFVPSQIVKRIPWRFLLLLVFLIILTACDSSSTGSSTNGYSNSFSTINSNSSSSSLDKVTALQMLHTMCNAVVNKDLQTGDFSQLYSMTSSSFQAHYSLNDMVTRMRGALENWLDIQTIMRIIHSTPPLPVVLWMQNLYQSPLTPIPLSR